MSPAIGFGRLLHADRPVPGALPATGPPTGLVGPPIRIRWHAPVPPPADPTPVWSGGAGAGDPLLFFPPGIARYRVAERAIEVTPLACARPQDVDSLLVATALPAALWLGGSFVLHAAAVVPDGGTGGSGGAEDAALAIAGPSGIGKSTLAAALVGGGAALVADDSIAVRVAGGRATGAGLAGGYHLWPDAARAFHPVAARRPSCALRALVVLDERARRAERLEGVAAVEALLAARHRPSVPRRCGLEPAALRQAACLAGAMAIYRWPRGEAPALLDAGVQQPIMGRGR